LYLPIALVLFAFFTYSISDLGTPNVENIYGGRINAIAGYQIHADTTRVFVATESANSVFYADMYTTTTGTPSVSKFTVVNSLDNTQDFGGGIDNIEIHEASASIYFVKENEIYTTNLTDTSPTNLGFSGTNQVLIKDNYLFMAGAGEINFGTINSSNVFSMDANSPKIFPNFTEPFKISVNASNNKMYAFSKGTNPKLYITSDDYNAFSGALSFTDVSPTLSSAGVTWTAFNIAPDGRYFIGGNNNTNKYIAYSDDNGTTWTEFSTGISGVSGAVIDFAGTAANYYVYFSSIESNNNGISGSWTNFGATSIYTHANDGTVYTDPVNSNIIYLTTDQGLGISFDKGLTVISADEGIEAVQVNDMEMTMDKDTAWVASKSGIRKVVDYTTSPSWSDAIFPNGDGSPYYSVAMHPIDSKIVYAGNLRVYKTTNDATTWSNVFTPESAPYNYSSVGTQANALTINPFDTDVVLAGFSQKDSNKGGLFYSLDAGVTWSQQLLHASSGVTDVDVLDIVFTKEGTDTIAYVGVEYDLATPTGRSVYKLVKNGASWIVSRDMDPATTSTSSTIVVSITDLDYSVSSNTVYATGTNAGTNNPVAYYKPLSGSGKWTPMGSSGFPSTPGKIGRAITYGIDTVYCAVDNEVYYYPTSGSSWTKGYTYPVGTKINFLYYDDLLVATDTGLYAQAGPSAATASIDEVETSSFIKMYPNPVASNETMIVNYSLDFDGDVFISIFNLQGKLLFKTDKKSQTNGVNSFDFKMPNLQTGLYFLSIQNGKRKILTKRIVIK